MEWRFWHAFGIVPPKKKGGEKMYDAYGQTPFMMKTRLRLILDFPGISKTFPCQQLKVKETPKKTVFLKNRQFLEPNHTLRNITKFL